MKISYNDPNRTKERQEVEPLTEGEMNTLVAYINKHSMWITGKYPELLQRLIDDYQNKCHYFNVKGGWGQTGDIEVNYEIVKQETK